MIDGSAVQSCSHSSCLGFRYCIPKQYHHVLLIQERLAFRKLDGVTSRYRKQPLLYGPEATDEIVSNAFKDQGKAVEDATAITDIVEWSALGIETH